MISIFKDLPSSMVAYYPNLSAAIGSPAKKASLAGHVWIKQYDKGCRYIFDNNGDHLFTGTGQEIWDFYDSYEFKSEGLKLHTLESWRNSGADSWTAYALPMTEISKDVYYYFMDIMPPITAPNGFLVGEVYRHNEEGLPEFSAFTCVNDRFYYLGEITRNDYKQACTNLDMINKLEES